MIQLQNELFGARAVQLFIKVFYAFWFFNFLRLMPIGNLIWGSDSRIIVYKHFEGFDLLSMLFTIESIRPFYLWFLIPLLILLLAGVVGFRSYLTNVLIWLLFANLHNANPEISNGGYHLSQQLFFFSIFLRTQEPNPADRFGALKSLLHNLGRISIWFQISIMYFMASTQKLLGDLWLSGDAMAIVLSLKEYSLPAIAQTIQTSTLFLKLITWAGLVYQLLFPVVIWLKPIRPTVLILGTIFHLFIAFVIGITDFGLILVVSYTIFFNEAMAKRCLEVIPDFASVLKRPIKAETG